MSRTQPDETLNSNESDNTIPFVNHREASPNGVQHSTDTSFVTIHANNTSNLLVEYTTTTSLENCEGNDATQSRDPLGILILVTNGLLIITAVIFVLSLCITFLTVGLAIVRMYLIENSPRANVTRKHMFGFS